MAGTQRYWDGQAWSDHIAPGQPQTAYAASPVAAGNNDTLVTWGWVTAILLPIVGFIIGIVLISRRANQGAAIMVVSIVAGVIWASQIG